MSPWVQESYKELVKIFPQENKALIKGNTSSKRKNFGTKLKEKKNLILKLLENLNQMQQNGKTQYQVFWTKPATSKLQTKNIRRN